MPARADLVRAIVHGRKPHTAPGVRQRDRVESRAVVVDAQRDGLRARVQPHGYRRFRVQAHRFDARGRREVEPPLCWVEIRHAHGQHDTQIAEIIPARAREAPPAD